MVPPLAFNSTESPRHNLYGAVVGAIIFAVPGASLVILRVSLSVHEPSVAVT